MAIELAARAWTVAVGAAMSLGRWGGTPTLQAIGLPGLVMRERSSLSAIWWEPRWRAASSAMRAAAQALHEDLLALEARTGMRTRRRRPADAEKFALEVERMLCNVAALRLAQVEGASLAIATNRRVLAGGSQTRNRLLQLTCTAGLVRHTMEGIILAGGEREPSRWQATPALYAYLPASIRLADLKLLREPRAFIAISAKDMGFLPLPAEATALDAEMHKINEWMRGLPISIDAGGAEAWPVEPYSVGTRARGEPLPPSRVLTAQHVELVRTFRGSLAEGGRMYLEGFWIGKSKEWRATNLRLAGEPVAECDYKATNLRLAYHHFGFPWPFTDADPYIAGPGARGGWKTVTNSMLRSASPLRNWPGNSEERRETREQFPSGTKFSQVKTAILHHHPALAVAGAFGCGIGGAFERTESDIVVALLLACRARDLPALPVHDCLLVPQSRAEVAAGLMRDVALLAAGVELPVAVQLRQSYV